MSCNNELSSLLPFYAAGALDDEERLVVEDHLVDCSDCRAELALWTGVGDAVVSRDAALPMPSTMVLDRALADIAESRVGLLERAWQLLLAQFPLVKREIWPASAVVMAIGYLLTVTTVTGEPNAIALELIAPLVAAVGLASIYGAENDPALELVLSTPTSPRQLLLARLLLVFGYDLLLALSATFGLLVAVPSGLLGSMILNWLGPMTFLSALALVLSLRTSTSAAITTASALWIARWLAHGIEHQPQFAVGFGPFAERLAATYIGIWANPGLLIGLAAVLVAASLLMVARRERFLSCGEQVG